MDLLPSFTQCFSRCIRLAYGTRGFRFEDFDLGIRLSFKTPNSQDDESVLWFRGGIPLSYRAGPLRVDTGAFMPVAFRHWWLGSQHARASDVQTAP